MNLWLVIIAGVCALSFWFGRNLLVPGADVSDSAVLSGPDAATSGLTVATDPVHLLVLNGSGQQGMARDFGLLLGRAGCVVERVGNAPHDHFDRTRLVNRDLTAEQARDLAARLGGLPVLLEFDPRSTVDAVLVLGRDAGDLRDRLRARAGT